MVLSTSNRCNLQCKGCYANAQKRNLDDELSAERISLLFSEAEDIGTRIIMLASGRGFINISSTGQLEPCPFAPYSDVNIKDMKLLEALKPGFLVKIREEHHMLKESVGGCSLWENKDWVEKQIAKEIA